MAIQQGHYAVLAFNLKLLERQFELDGSISIFHNISMRESAAAIRENGYHDMKTDLWWVKFPVAENPPWNVGKEKKQWFIVGGQTPKFCATLIARCHSGKVVVHIKNKSETATSWEFEVPDILHGDEYPMLCVRTGTDDLKPGITVERQNQEGTTA